jgi:hypothetical protein
LEAQRVLVNALVDLQAGRWVSEEAIEAAAKHVFAAIQEALAEQAGEGSILPPAARRDVYGAVAQARAPIVERHGGRKVAKLIQIKATGGRPLAVCFGRGARRVNGRIHFAPYGDGCGRLFVDESLVRFSRYCPECRKKPGGRFKQEAISRAQAGASGRIRVVRYDAEANPVEVWRLSCSSCGERFDTLEPRVRRCDRCRHGHRSPRT